MQQNNKELENIQKENITIENPKEEQAVEIAGSQTNPMYTEIINTIQEKPVAEIKPVQQENPNQDIAAQNDIPKLVGNAIPETVKYDRTPKPETKDVHTYLPDNLTMVQPKEKRDNYTYIPSQNSVLNNVQDTSEKVKKYIPSQNVGNLAKSFDNSGLSQALKRADKAEQMAINILSGKF